MINGLRMAKNLFNSITKSRALKIMTKIDA